MTENQIRKVVRDYSNGEAVSTIARRVNASATEVRKVLLDRGFILLGKDAGLPESLKTNTYVRDDEPAHHTMPASEISQWMRLWMPRKAGVMS